jgi:hypothetical protein
VPEARGLGSRERMCIRSSRVCSALTSVEDQTCHGTGGRKELTNLPSCRHGTRFELEAQFALQCLAWETR